MCKVWALLTVFIEFHAYRTPAVLVVTGSPVHSTQLGLINVR